MKGRIILADHASSHHDGTFSLLKAGIDRLNVIHQPYLFRASLVARFTSDLADEGKHEFDIKCVDVDGRPVLPPLNGNFTAPRGGGSTNLIMGIDTVFPSLGRYIFYLRIDNKEEDSWEIQVIQVDPPQQTEEEAE